MRLLQVEFLLTRRAAARLLDPDQGSKELECSGPIGPGGDGGFEVVSPA